MTVLKRNFRNGFASKKTYELLQEASRLYKEIPQEDSAVIRTRGKAKCACHSAEEGECKTHEVQTTNDGSDQVVSYKCKTDYGELTFQVLESVECEPGQFGRGASQVPNCLYHPGEPHDDVCEPLSISFFLSFFWSEALTSQ